MDDTDLHALNRCLRSLKHLHIDLHRVTPNTSYLQKRGGYGDVQVATLDIGTLSARSVVSKTIRLYHTKKRPLRLILRFARELRLWSGLQHAHILPLLGYYLDDERRKAVLISEYMCNGDLKDYIEETNPSWNARMSLARDFTDGLSYLHSRTPPVCHGDLKMGNVLVNGQLRAVLADFGLSDILEDEATGLTTSDGLKGTVRYYSPELVLEPDAKHSLQSDTWAWGCLVLETLTDTIPYADKKSDPALWLALANEEKPANLESFSSLRPELSQWLSKCWQARPSDRPPASECLQALNALALPQKEVADVRVTELEGHSSALNDPIGQASRPLSPLAFQDVVDQAWELEDLDLDSDPVPETVLGLMFAPSQRRKRHSSRRHMDGIDRANTSEIDLKGQVT